ncbi:MAG: glycosyltransferase family 1 protein [Patescibacteria group bacterium]
MKIGIDARFYGSLGKGLGRYASELIAHLEQLDANNEYVVFLRAGNWNEYEPKAPNFRKVLADYPWYTWREQLLYPFFLRHQRLDLMHFLHFNVPILYRRPFIVTVHDLILLQFPTTRASTLGPIKYWLKHRLYRWVIGRAIKRAEVVLTVSKTIRQEIKKFFPAAQQKQIIVTYGACPAALRASSKTISVDHTQEAVGPHAPFALYVGNAYPHKNLEQLIAAFQMFRESGHVSWQLVLVGAPDYFYERLKKETTALGLTDHVIFFGQATDYQLMALYREARFYVFPSLCEGFGLPPLEAMDSGLPVAASDASCLPEVLGAAAIYFNGKSTTDIAEKLSLLADDENLRKKMIAAGYQQTQKYDWQVAAKKTLDAYISCTK